MTIKDGIKFGIGFSIGVSIVGAICKLLSDGMKEEKSEGKKTEE